MSPVGHKPTGGALPLVGGAAIALCNPYEVDGRVSWHAPEARGYAPFNCLLFTEGDRALLVDTGLTVHEADLLAQLRANVPHGGTLDVAILRQGEFDSLCNLVPVLRDFAGGRLYGQFDDVIGWASFRPEQDGDSRAQRRRIATTIMRRGDALILGPERTVRVVKPMLRLLTTFWLFDEQTGTLCTSDVFTHARSASPDGPWVVTSETDETTYEDVRDHLLATRYWWIPHARLDDVRRDLAAIFDQHEVRCIAPAWGCVLQGADVVARHVALVDEVLRREGRGANG